MTTTVVIFAVTFFPVLGVVFYNFLFCWLLLSLDQTLLPLNMGATKLLIPSAARILISFILLTILHHSTPEQVGINLIFLGIGSGLFVTLDAIVILFISEAVMGNSDTSLGHPSSW